MTNWDLGFWFLGASIAIIVLVRMAERRRKELRALLYDYVQRQLLWVRRKEKAAELKLAKKNSDNSPVDGA